MRHPLPFPRYKAGAGWREVCGHGSDTPKGPAGTSHAHTSLPATRRQRPGLGVQVASQPLFVGEEDYMGLLKPSLLWFLAGTRGKWLVATGGRRETHSDVSPGLSCWQYMQGGPLPLREESGALLSHLHPNVFPQPGIYVCISNPNHQGSEL